MDYWDQPQLFGDDRLRVDVAFSFLEGWRWSVHHWNMESWAVIDSGLTTNLNEGLRRAASCLLELTCYEEY